MREILRQDVTFALRQIRWSPGMALAVILTLALRSTTAVFTLVSTILVRPFPFHEPDRLVRIQTRNTETGTLVGNNEPNLLEWRAAASIDMLAYNYWMRSQPTRDGGAAVPVRTAWVNPQFFSTFSWIVNWSDQFTMRRQMVGPVTT